MAAARSSMTCIGLLIAAIMGCSAVVDAAKPAHGHRHEHLRNHVNRVLAHAEATAPTTGSTTHFFTDAVLDHYSYRFGSLSGGSSNLRWKQRFYVNARRSSAEHLIATKALRLHSYGLDAHCR